MKQIKMNNLKDMKKYWIKQEASIHLDKEPGRDRSSMVIKGDTASIFTLICSMYQQLLENKVFTKEEIADIHKLFIGGKHESK